MPVEPDQEEEVLSEGLGRLYRRKSLSSGRDGQESEAEEMAKHGAERTALALHSLKGRNQLLELACRPRDGKDYSGSDFGR